ncbi:hypothetical protein AB0D42_26885 [Streptomyces sp. NPDC048304]|uniref:hypothetical protein n=1 Tax=Streptomyces sp. NPDC048304 TaxID=3154820 RepID=UPI0033DD147B
MSDTLSPEAARWEPDAERAAFYDGLYAMYLTWRDAARSLGWALRPAAVPAAPLAGVPAASPSRTPEAPHV